MSKQYRKKPVVIEAMEFTDKTKDQVFNWVSCNHYPHHDENGEPVLMLQTLSGDVTIRFGDYVLKGVAGEFYPCKSNIFKETYEEV